jgi:hypothetical protein
MIRRKDIQDELLGLAPELAAAPAETPYRVPSEYFSMLPELILQRIRQEPVPFAEDDPTRLSPLLSVTPKSLPFDLPHGYFDTLPQLIMSRIKDAGVTNDPEELETLSPLLSSIGKQMPYSVPAGYFENLAENLKPGARQPAKVVALSARRIFRYAAAAVTIGLIFIAAWFYNRQPAEPSITATSPIGVDSTGQIDIKMESISEQEIASYIDEGSLVYPLDNTFGGDELADIDATVMFEDISDRELEQYLQLNQPQKEKYN